MPPLSPRRSIFLLLLLTLTTAGFLPAAYSQSTTAPYGGCQRTFSCGHITGLTFPFSGGDRPALCGLPEFALTCRNGSVTEFTHNSVPYKILQLYPIQKKMILSRSDLQNHTTICPSKFHNTTLSTALFSYIGTQNEALNLFYGCDTTKANMSITPHNKFYCNSSGLNFTNAYYLVGAVPTDPILRIIFCSVNLNVPMLREVGNRLAASQMTLGDALMAGFSVNYTVRHGEWCSKCNKLRGECGFDSGSDQPVCLCKDGPCPFQVTPRHLEDNANSEVPKRRITKRDIGLFVAGGVLTGVGLGWLIFSCRQRRKQLIASRSAQVVTKNIASNSSSAKVLSSVPWTDFAKSLSSYPSTKSDLAWGSLYFGLQVFTYAELQAATNNFDPSRELGEGGFGTVYRGVLLDGRVVAVKRLFENNFKRVEQFMNEVEILTRLRHQSLVTLYGCTSKQSRELLLVYEYIPNGTVADHLHGNRAKFGLLSWPLRLSIAVETADALAYLHKSDTIHRDVKTNNILLDNDFCVKVADFGLSRLFPNDVTHLSTAPQGTPGYVDPEYYQCYQVTEKSDVYSFGVVLSELISSLQAVDTSRHRHDINLSNMAVNKIQNGSLHELVDANLGFETDSNVQRMVMLVAELAFRCLQQDRDLRPSMEVVLETLRQIQSDHLNGHKADIVDTSMDDNAALLKSPTPPDSVSIRNWVTC